MGRLLGTNLLALAAVHDLGARITQVTSQDGSRAELRDKLQSSRVELSITRARPVRWVLHDEVVELQDMAQGVLDVVDGKRSEVAKPMTLKERALLGAGRLLLHNDSKLARRLTDPVLHGLGVALCDLADGRMEQCLDEALPGLRTRERGKDQTTETRERGKVR